MPGGAEIALVAFLVLGLRLDLDTAGGEPPLWGYPWVTLRGVPALRYQNETTGVVETELWWNIDDRWAAPGCPRRVVPTKIEKGARRAFSRVYGE